MVALPRHIAIPDHKKRKAAGTPGETGMSAFGALGKGTRVAVLLLGGAAVAGGGYLGWRLTRPDPLPAEPQAAPAADAAAVASPEPASDGVATSATAQSEPAAEPETPARPLPAQPLIDTWRVAADGGAVVSGSAEPGATIEVMVDGTSVASGTATASGEFAILFTLAPNPKPSLMWLQMTVPDQDPVPSREMVALGPVEGPKPAVAAEDSAPAAEQVAAAEEPAAPPALLLSEEGAVLLQDPATPDPVAAPTASIMIDTIAYTPEGDVQIGGRGAGGAALRIYLDNAETTTAAERALARNPARYAAGYLHLARRSAGRLGQCHVPLRDTVQARNA
jgi:hypothetical protein